MRAGACRVLELFISRFDRRKARPRYGGTPAKAVMVAGAADGCNRQPAKIPANQRFLPALTAPFFATVSALWRPLTRRWPLLGAALLSGILVHRIDTVDRGGADRRRALGQAGRRAARAPSRRRSCSCTRRRRHSPARRPSWHASRRARASSPRAEADATLRTEIVRRSLAASQRRIARAAPRALHPGRARSDRGDPRRHLARRGDDGDRGALPRDRAERAARAGSGREGPDGSTELRGELAAQRDRLDGARAAARAGDGEARSRRRPGRRETVASDSAPGRR